MSDSGMNEAGRQDDGQAMTGAGAQLAAHRQQRGWSIEQVASQLNLAPRQVVAIESDDYAALPGMPIVRGFVRAYAKLLKIDPAPLLATMPGETVVANESASLRRSVSAPFLESRMPSMSDRSGMSGKRIAGLVLLVLIAAAIWAVQRMDGLSGLAGEGMTVRELAGVSESTPVPPAPTPEPVPEVAAPVPDQTAQAPVRMDEAATSPPPATSSPASAPDAALLQQDAAASAVKNTLVLSVREDSWVEIKGADNRPVISRVVPAGTTETVEITGPLSVVIGNAAGVDVTLRGEPLELKTGARGNVARMSVK